MLHLLLVSTQTVIQRMALFDSRQDLITLKDQNNSEIHLTSKKDPILCNHCIALHHPRDRQREYDIFQHFPEAILFDLCRHEEIRVSNTECQEERLV